MCAPVDRIQCMHVFAGMAPPPLPPSSPPCAVPTHSPHMFRSQIEHANRIAAEIEGQVSSNVHEREERGQAIDDSGLDEEDRFSGVARPKTASGVCVCMCL